MREDEVLLPDEASEVAWIEYISNFKNTVYAVVYQPFGFSLPEAFLVWTLNKLNNNIIDVEAAIKDHNEGV